ncbi:MAG: hypothetical protein H0T46_02440 [Deltaproteobacteria bacterium]|nr:hypothetical protein [Deltaproteobacteria bacterium]
MRAAAVLLVILASVAHAEPTPDPAATRAGDANLESIEHRRGIVFGGALGPSVTIGGGTGTGGNLALKLGHVATPKTVLMMILGGSAQFHRDLNMNLVANNLTYALVGVQYWPGPSLWLNLSAGAGTYHCNQCVDEASIPQYTKRAGPGGGVGAGVDLVRFRGVVLGLEVYSVGLITREGFIMTSGMSLGLAFD